MAGRVCPQCGAPIDPTATECKFCGEKLAVQQTAQQMQSQQAYVQQPQVVIQQTVPQQTGPQQVYVTGINPAWPVKNKLVAGLLGIFLGGLGVHKFYMGKIGLGILYLCFCWTYVPAIIGLVEGIIYLCSSNENFQLKNHVRIE